MLLLQTEADILLRSDLEQIVKENPDRFHLWYTLDRPHPGRYLKPGSYALRNFGSFFLFVSFFFLLLLPLSSTSFPILHLFLNSSVSSHYSLFHLPFLLQLFIFVLLPFLSLVVSSLPCFFFAFSSFSSAKPFLPVSFFVPSYFSYLMSCSHSILSPASSSSFPSILPLIFILLLSFYHSHNFYSSLPSSSSSLASPLTIFFQSVL